ncbi:MAG: alpha-mannosidase [Candidatus Acidiferrales bacterium]
MATVKRGYVTPARTVRGFSVGKFWIALFTVALVLSCFAAASAHPQSALSARQPSTSTQQTIAQLAALNELPTAEWRYHVGDVAHGEAADLDDKNWEVVRGDSHAPNEAVWYRRWIEVPKTLDGYDLTGARIWFQFEADANGPMPQIIYFNGRRVAMGDDLEPIMLFDKTSPSDRALVAVKLLHTVDRKHFAGAHARIEFTPSRPNPDDLRQELLSVTALLPTLGANAAEVLAQLDASASLIDLKALHAADQKSFDASLSRAWSSLEAIKPKLQQTAIRLSGNSHIDAAWLWPWTETVDVVRRTFSTALQLMDEYPQYTYTQSAAAYSDWVEQKYPAEFQQIVQRVKEGRWELVGGMWVEPDLNMPDGESLVRQLLIGKRYFKDKFDVDVRIGWNPDSFGYTWQLPQIYKKSGVDYFVTQKMAWNDTNKLPMKLFWWQSPDGSRVLTYFPHDYANGIDPVKIAADVNRAREMNPGLSELMHLFGVGDHGGGPTRAMLDDGIHWTDPKMVYPPTTFGVSQGFFSSVETKLDTEHAPVWNYKSMAAAGSASLPAPPDGKISLPIWNDELYFEYHRGVFTTQANHKRNMRDSEEQLLNAEKYSSLAWLSGNSYPTAQLTEAWKKVLFNQFHDLAAGSGIGVIYKDAQHDYDVVRWTARDATTNALHAMAAQVNTSSIPGVPVLVMNPLAWSRTDLVQFDVQMPEALKTNEKCISVLDPQGRSLPVQVLSTEPATNTFHLLVQVRDVPSLGYEVLHVTPAQGAPQSQLKTNKLTLENSVLRVAVDSQTGCITSLYDKKSSFEFIAAGGCGNYDAWNIDANFEQHFDKLDKADSVQLIERGPLRATIRVSRTWQNSKFVQDICLYAGLDRVDIANHIDWHETHVLLKAAFPLAASSDSATFEIPYGSIERPTTRNNSWEAAKFEVPALRWADLGDTQHGFSLINNSIYGYDAKGNVLRLSLLRSPTWPDPEADRGHHDFSYSLYPHAGSWKQALTVRRGYEFNYKLEAEQVEAHEGVLPPQQSFVSAAPENVVLTAMKKSEDGDSLILRFYEWAGESANIHITLPKGAASASIANLMEHPEESTLTIMAEHEITVPIDPYEILTLRVNYSPHSQ